MFVKVEAFGKTRKVDDFYECDDCTVIKNHEDSSLFASIQTVGKHGTMLDFKDIIIDDTITNADLHLLNNGGKTIASYSIIYTPECLEEEVDETPSK